MNPAEYDRMFENEDHYWWYVSRRELVVSFVRRLRLPEKARLLDVGCGTGATASALREFGRVTAADASPLALERCGRRGLTELVLARAEGLPFRDASIDVIVATDILEHTEDDLSVLLEFRRVLRPGGHAVISVPAYMMLWSEHDIALMHKRRYVAGTLRARIREAGMVPVRLSYALGFLLPLAFGRLLKPKPRGDKMPEAQLWPVPKALNRALILFQRLETMLLQHVSLPCGLSVVAVVQKPAEITLTAASIAQPVPVMRVAPVAAG